jgi:hypothetical protein
MSIPSVWSRDVWTTQSVRIVSAAGCESSHEHGVSAPRGNERPKMPQQALNRRGSTHAPACAAAARGLAREDVA